MEYWLFLSVFCVCALGVGVGIGELCYRLDRWLAAGEAAVVKPPSDSRGRAHVDGEALDRFCIWIDTDHRYVVYGVNVPAPMWGEWVLACYTSNEAEYMRELASWSDYTDCNPGF